MVPHLDIFVPEATVFRGLEPGSFSGVHGVESRGWLSAEAGGEWLEELEGREDPWGLFLCEGKSYKRREVVFQPGGSPRSAGPGLWEKQPWCKGNRRESSLISRFQWAGSFAHILS